SKPTMLRQPTLRLRIQKKRKQNNDFQFLNIKDKLYGLSFFFVFFKLFPFSVLITLLNNPPITDPEVCSNRRGRCFFPNAPSQCLYADLHKCTVPKFPLP